MAVAMSYLQGRNYASGRPLKGCIVCSRFFFSFNIGPDFVDPVGDTRKLYVASE